MSTHKKISIIIAVVSLLPILLVQDELWDGVHVDLAYKLQDFSYIKLLFQSLGLHLMYAFRLVVNEVSLATNIPYKLIMNVLAVMATIGMSYETYKYLKHECGLSDQASYVGAWIILAFPLWHINLISGLQIRILLMWFFIIAINLWHKNKPLALLFLVPSLQFFALFSLAVGFIYADYILNVNRRNFCRKSLASVALSVCLLAGFVLINKVTNIHGVSHEYNNIKLNQLYIPLTYFLTIVCLLGAAWGGMAKLMKEKQVVLGFLRKLAVVAILFFFAGLPYWAVGRPLRFFTFGSFGGRHAVLTCFAFALLVAIVVEIGLRYWKERLVHAIIGVILSSSIVLLYQGYDHKVAALLFRNMLTYSFRHVEKPPSGYISIREDGYKAPRHVHDYAVDMCLYRAYGSFSWVANGFWAKRGHVWNKEDMIERYARTRASDGTRFGSELTGDHFTAYAFTLDDYHQEGRLWYWYAYTAEDYSHFRPRLTRLPELDTK